ncbi:glutathione S-transferase [Myxococcota bacterium]|nr:glutathione S-transferase [Myxococcota bacterium]
MLTVYHLVNSRSDRIVWLVEELGVDYELIHFERDPKTGRAPAALQKLHPFARSPLVRDGELLLAESGAIIETLAAKYGAGTMAVDPTEEEYPRYLHWLHFAEGSSMFQLVLGMFLSGELGGDAHALAPTVQAGLQDQFRYIDGELASREYLVADRFTAADLIMAFGLIHAHNQERIGDCKQIEAYVARLTARPAYQRAVQRMINPTA